MSVAAAAQLALHNQPLSDTVRRARCDPCRAPAHRCAPAHRVGALSNLSKVVAVVQDDPQLGAEGLGLTAECGDTLSLGDYRTVEYHGDRLAETPMTLGEPYSRHLRGAHLGRPVWRISYWLVPRQRIVLLTVFRKTRSRETTEVDRAVAAQRVCEEQHAPATHIYDRRDDRR